MSEVACTCRIRWRRLHTIIEGARCEVEPCSAETAISLLFRAWCTDCGAEFTHPFRVTAAHHQAA